MSPYFATHAGLLQYVADDFSALAGRDREFGDKLALYADILRHMIDELATKQDDTAPAPEAIPA
ncbi:hypothetical protein [Elstera cyanobacteriorum]|uniref:Uncharacterized protein n=1 Tax=Elstera cyanobacteriorum TaxID=2022747 RepID=A0A255XIZ4_9PROT|nr:hypothetical protein [Elstera cyanobacteriorum]MCK6443858.1 hypothetical protein [Elstera cyanobacteriorum]OYQ16943.1 hypothetical protein CHR90_18440 [Elstera cyanobacteriorum]GFZ89630.1 hypothetical protein GCM10011497_18950 [Elstera cyanobacteriorum]